MDVCVCVCARRGCGCVLRAGTCRGTRDGVNKHLRTS